VCRNNLYRVNYEISTIIDESCVVNGIVDQEKFEAFQKDVNDWKDHKVDQKNIRKSNQYPQIGNSEYSDIVIGNDIISDSNTSFNTNAAYDIGETSTMFIIFPKTYQRRKSFLSEVYQQLMSSIPLDSQAKDLERMIWEKRITFYNICSSYDVNNKLFEVGNERLAIQEASMSTEFMDIYFGNSENYQDCDPNTKLVFRVLDTYFIEHSFTYDMVLVMKQLCNFLGGEEIQKEDVSDLFVAFYHSYREFVKMYEAYRKKDPTETIKSDLSSSFLTTVNILPLENTAVLPALIDSL